MTPTAAVREALGPSYRMKSDREIAHIVVSVLRACREPSEGVVVVGDEQAIDVLNDHSFALKEPTLAERVFTAMIDALIEEVTAEGGR